MRRSLLVVSGLVLALACAPLAAAARDNAQTPPTPVSGGNPFHPTDRASTCGSAIRYQGWETDSTLAVDPGDPNHLVTAWTQDWADGIMVANSENAGVSWHQSVPRTSDCTWRLNGDLLVDERLVGSTSAFDPVLAIGQGPGARQAYLSSVVAWTYFSASALVVNPSTDAGRTWQAPAVIDRAALPYALDTSFVLADPEDPNVAHVAWVKALLGAGTSSGYLSTTWDGGRSWSRPVELPPSASRRAAAGFWLGTVPSPDDRDTLVAVNWEVPVQPLTPNADITGPATFVVRRSLDAGATWSPPTPFVDAADGDRPALPNATVGPDGTVWVVWVQKSEGFFDIVFTRSPDGGITWSTPRPLGPPIQGDPVTNGRFPVAPSVAVLQDGTVAVSFYDHRADPGNSVGQSLTEVWVRFSRNEGRTWREEHVDGPFDQNLAPDYQARVKGEEGYAGGYLGDFHSSAALEGAVGLVWVRTLPGDPEPAGGVPTDLFFTRVRP